MCRRQEGAALSPQEETGRTCLCVGWWGELHTPNKENGQKARINYEEGKRGVYLRLPSKGEEAQKETEKY